MNPNETKVLVALVDGLGDDEYFYGFDAISELVHLDRKTVRRACRSLTRKGFARFARGLWTEDGEPRGSGYGATQAGAELIHRECDRRERAS